MIQSMTGFGSGENKVFRVEIRSINHRFMDVAVKIPQSLGQHEIPLRNMLREKFSRGKFDVLVSVVSNGRLKVKTDMNLAREVYNQLLAMKSELSLSGTIGVETISQFRELIISEEIEYNAELLYDAFDRALLRLKEMRVKEGEVVSLDISSRLESVEKMKDEIAFLCPDAVNNCKGRFIERLKDLMGNAKYDENRMLQEAAIMAEKTDISEEITRTSSHIAQMRKILSDGDTIGRKLEFLLQELNREVNTIASKSEDYRISNIAIDMKAEIEKMREQAQNIQ